jgi:hypothetical protein
VECWTNKGRKAHFNVWPHWMLSQTVTHSLTIVTDLIDSVSPTHTTSSPASLSQSRFSHSSKNKIKSMAKPEIQEKKHSEVSNTIVYMRQLQALLFKDGDKLEINTSRHRSGSYWIETHWVFSAEAQITSEERRQGVNRLQLTLPTQYHPHLRQCRT